jgi:hypothetical protein
VLAGLGVQGYVWRLRWLAEHRAARSPTGWTSPEPARRTTAPPYRPPVRRAAPVLLLLPLLAACGQAQDPRRRDVARAPPSTRRRRPPTRASLLAGVPAAAEAAGSVRYESVTEGALDGEPDEVEGRLSASST